MKKWIMILTIVLAGFLVVFMWGVQKNEKEKAAYQEKLDNQKRPLAVQKQQLERELDDLKNIYEQSRHKKATVQVLFSSLDPQVYSLCYPVLKAYGFVGNLALSETQLPGAEGCMSVEQFQELIAEGWRTCITWNSQVSVEEWLPSLKEKLADADLELGQTMYFPTNTYCSAYDAKLQDLGFKIVVHHGEEDSVLIPTTANAEFWHIGAVGMMGDSPKIRMNEAIAQRGNMVFTVGFELEEELYNERSYKSMLNHFGQHSANEGLVVTSIEAAWDYHQGQTIEEEKEQDAIYQQEKAALEAELAEIREQLKEIEALYE